MENATMGRVIVSAKIENIHDLYQVDQGHLPADQVRTVEVTDALVDTGATSLSMPARLIAPLGLLSFGDRRVRTSAGPVTVRAYGGVLLTVQGRKCLCDVTELPDDCPILIGQVPLELLDFVVDPKGQRLIGNPEHGGIQMFDQF